MTVRYALRFAARELPLDGAVFVLGSGAGCDIRLEAGGVRGRHVIFISDEQGWNVEPLEGEVRIDAKPTSGPVRLSHGAQIQVGGAQLTFIDYHEGGQRERTTTAQMPVSDALVSALDGLDQLDDAIDQGKWKEAGERLEILSVSIPDEITRSTFLDALVRCSAQVATGTKDSNWVDWLLELCRVHNHVPSSQGIDLIANAARVCGWRGSRTLDRYVESLSGVPTMEQVRIRRLVAISRSSR